MQMPNNNALEQKIIDVAKDIFVKKGFEETSMCDIAAAAGVTRPALHYYFRTKEKLFHAVFGGIIQSLAPEIEGIIQSDTPALAKLSRLADIYIGKFLQEPSLPMFIIMEIQRDAGHLVETAEHLNIRQYVVQLSLYFHSEMKKGNIREVPLYTLFYTFFGLLAYPFLTRNLAHAVAGETQGGFEAIIRTWKPYVMQQLETLLRVG